MNGMVFQNVNESCELCSGRTVDEICWGLWLVTTIALMLTVGNFKAIQAKCSLLWLSFAVMGIRLIAYRHYKLGALKWPFSSICRETSVKFVYRILGCNCLWGLSSPCFARVTSHDPRGRLCQTRAREITTVHFQVITNNVCQTVTVRTVRSDARSAWRMTSKFGIPRNFERPTTRQ